MRTKTHDRTNPLLIIIIILIHANLQGTLASPASHREDLQVHTSHAEAVRQDKAHSLRYYHANPSTLRTSAIASNHVLQLEFIAPPGGAWGSNLVKQQQAVRERVPVVRNVKHANAGLTQSEEDVDYDYEQQLANMDDISAASFQPLTSRKRGFSVLARWKPFTNISKLRVSSRQQQQQLLRPIIAQQKAQAQAQQMLSSAANDYDVISAETRALLLRPSGQPLRWG